MIVPHSPFGLLYRTILPYMVPVGIPYGTKLLLLASRARQHGGRGVSVQFIINGNIHSIYNTAKIGSFCPNCYI